MKRRHTQRSTAHLRLVHSASRPLAFSDGPTSSFSNGGTGDVPAAFSSHAYDAYIATLGRNQRDLDMIRQRFERQALSAAADHSLIIHYTLDTQMVIFANPTVTDRYEDIATRGHHHPLLADIEKAGAQAFAEAHIITREVRVGAMNYQQAITPHLSGDDRIITIVSEDITLLKQAENGWDED